MVKARPKAKQKARARADRVVSPSRGIAHPRGINAIIVKRLELSILTGVTVRFVIVVIVIRTTTRMVFTVREIP